MSGPAPEVESGERGSPAVRRAGLVIGSALFLVFLLAPGIDLTGPQRGVAATAAITATFWVTVAIPIGAASLLPAVLFPLLGVLPADQAAPPYMSNLVILFVGAFVIALGLERWGVHRRMALFLVSLVGIRPRGLVLGFMIAAAFLSLWINNTATTLMMLPIGVAVIESVRAAGGAPAGAEPTPSDRAFATSLLLGVAYSASVGGMGTPVGTAPNQQFLGQLEVKYPHGPQITFGEWSLAWIPLVLLFIACAWVLLTRILFRVGGRTTAGAEVVRAERRRLGRMGRGERLMAALFALTALLWITRADLDLGGFRLPGWNRLLLGDAAADPAWYRAHKNDISDSTVALFMAVVAFLVPVEPRRGVWLMSWRTARKLPWDILLLLGGGICLARGFASSGLDAVIGELLAPALSGRAEWVVVAGTVLLVTFLTELTSNTATAAVLLPILAEAGHESGFHPLLLMAPATIAASSAFMLPSATPPNAVVFASRQVEIGRMARTGLVLNFLMVVLVTLVFQLWVRPLWGIGSGVPSWAGP